MTKTKRPPGGPNNVNQPRCPTCSRYLSKAMAARLGMGQEAEKAPPKPDAPKPDAPKPAPAEKAAPRKEALPWL